MSLSHPVQSAVRHHLETAQRALRLPTLSAAVAGCDGEPLLVGLGEPQPGADVQYRIGSITKTFTAALVFQQRDAGALGLDDRLGDHLPHVPFGELRLRDLLGHRAGLATEPPSPFWEAAPGRDAEALLAGLSADDVVLAPGRAWHYSNLAYALLGLVVARVAGAPYRDVLAERLLLPLGLDRTTWLPQRPHADGVRLVPFTDEVVPEPAPDTGVMGPAGQLWSTSADLCRWGAFLAAPDAAVLAPSSVEEMAEPVAMVDLVSWTAGAGLGLQLQRSGARVYVGHGGSMPGFTAGLLVDRSSGAVAAVCGDRWRAAGLSALAADLLDEVLAGDRAPRPAWTPAAARPADVVGVWWWRKLAFVVRADAADLLLATLDDPDDADRFAPAGDDRYVGVDGAGRGERLVVDRDPAGSPAVLRFGSLRLTRDPDDPRGD